MYELSGTFLEVCDCYALCPCWLDRPPDDGECTGVFGWDVEAGTIDGVDVAGCRVASVSYHVGPRHHAQQRVVLFVDAAASDDQLRVLTDAFVGRLGGPLGELFGLLGELVDVRRADIAIERPPGGVRLSVGSRVRAAARSILGPSGRPAEIADGALSLSLGTPATIGETTSYRVDLPGVGIDVDVRGRSATSGHFAYHAGAD